MGSQNSVTPINNSSNSVNDQMKNNMSFDVSQSARQNNTQNKDCKFLKSFC